MFVQLNSLTSVKAYFSDQLKDHFSQNEIRLIVRECVCHRLGLSFSEYILNGDFLFSESDLLYFRAVLNRLVEGVPFQYIVQSAHFFGINIYVSPGVLIPRPETEELVDWLRLECQNQSKLQILDICSGSGCIAFALERFFNQARITAIELSAEAIAVLKENSLRLDSSIDVLEGDVLVKAFWDLLSNESFDVFVSNPPYIMENEVPEMSPTVLLHEPHQALFVPSDDPLLFYRKIISFGYSKLKRGGKMFFEINPLYAKDLITLMEDHHLVNITLRKDLQHKDRMLMGQKP